MQIKVLFLDNYGYPCPLSEESKVYSIAFESGCFGIIYSDTRD